MRRFLPIVMTGLLLAGCNGGQAEDGVGGVTSDEAAALNSAAEMLDTSPDSLRAPSDEVENGVIGNAAE